MPYFRIRTNKNTVDYVIAENPYDAHLEFQKINLDPSAEVAYVDHVEWGSLADVRREIGLAMACIGSIAVGADSGCEELDAESVKRISVEISKHMDLVKKAQEFMFWLEIKGDINSSE